MPEFFKRAFHRQFGEPLATAAMIGLLVITGAITLRNLGRLRKDSLEIGRSYDVMNVVDAIEYSLTQWDDCQRAFLATGQESERSPYRIAEVNLEGQFARLFGIAAEDKVYDPLSESALSLVRQLRDEAARQIESARGAPAQSSVEDAERTANLKSDIAKELSALRSMAKTNATLRQSEAVTSYQIARSTALISTLAGLTLVGGVMLAVYRRRVEAERDALLVDRESKLRQSTLDALAKYVIVCDSKQDIVTVNEALLKLFNIRREDVVGKKFAEVADGQWNLEGVASLINDVNGDGGSDREIEIKHRFGSVANRVLQLRCRQFSADSHGDPLTLLIISIVTYQNCGAVDGHAGFDEGYGRIACHHGTPNRTTGAADR